MSLLIPAKFGPVVDMASEEESRPFLCGVHVMTTEDLRLRLEVTDGAFALIVEETEEGLKQRQVGDYPLIPGVDMTADNERTPMNLIVPGEAWKAAFATAKKTTRRASMPILSNVLLVRHAEDSITLASTNLETPSIMRVKPIAGAFPPFHTAEKGGDVEHPKDGEPFGIAFDPVRIATIHTFFANLGFSWHNPVQWRFFTPLTPAHAFARDLDLGFTYHAILAPVRV